MAGRASTTPVGVGTTSCGAGAACSAHGIRGTIDHGSLASWHRSPSSCSKCPSSSSPSSWAAWCCQTCTHPERRQTIANHAMGWCLPLQGNCSTPDMPEHSAHIGHPSRVPARATDTACTDSGPEAESSLQPRPTPTCRHNPTCAESEFDKRDGGSRPPHPRCLSPSRSVRTLSATACPPGRADTPGRPPGPRSGAKGPRGRVWRSATKTGALRDGFRVRRRCRIGRQRGGGNYSPSCSKVRSGR